MKNKNLKNYLLSLVLILVGIVSIRFNGKPFSLGYIFSLFMAFFAGTYLTKIYSGISGGLIVLLGFFLRKIYPVVSNLKGEKLEVFLEKNTSYNTFISKYFILMILLGVVFGILGSLIGDLLTKDREKKITVNRLVYMAIFVAIGVIINSLRVGKVSFGGFPIILSGYLLGPIGGFIVGGVTDLVAFMVRPPSMPFNIIYVFTSALTGFIPVIVTNLLGEKYPKYSFIKILIGVCLGQFITSVLIAPYASSILFGKYSFYYYFIGALVKQAISVPFYAFFILSLNDRFTGLINFDRLENFRSK